MRILLTGATGFLGQRLQLGLAEAGHVVIPAVRLASGLQREIVVGEIGADTCWEHALKGTDAVIHCAAVTSGQLREVNHFGSANLAAASAGRIKRFLHVSTIKVLGETAALPLDETAPLRPADAYGRSKADGELAVASALAGSSTTLTILRPPLVYGRGQNGNFQKLAALVRRGIPLPLASIANRRSLIHVDNLSHAIITGLDAPPGVYHVSDGKDLSTPDWIRLAARIQGVPARLFGVSPGLLRWGLHRAGLQSLSSRLLDSLALDCRRARTILGPPPFTIEEGFARSFQQSGGVR